MRVLLALVGAIAVAAVAAWLALTLALPAPRPPPAPRAAMEPTPKNVSSAVAIASSVAPAIDPPKRTGPIPQLEVQEVEATGRQPKGAFLSHDGKRLYVTNFGELMKKKCVSVYDADTLALVDEIDLPGEAVKINRWIGRPFSADPGDGQ